MSAAAVQSIRDPLNCGRSNCACRRNGNTHCPAHSDDSPSLSVKAGSKVPVIVACHGGCSQEAVIDALKERGLWPQAAKPERRDGRGPATEKRYAGYSAIDRRRVGDHVRFDLPGGEKRMWWEQPDGTKNLDGFPVTELELYGVREPSGGPVVVVEGEKARDALNARGVAAVATMTGAAATPCDDALRPLSGRDVRLWPDADDAGRQHMQRIAARLHALGAAAVKTVDWPEGREHDDAADFIGSDEELRALIDGAVPYTDAPPGQPLSAMLDAVCAMLAQFVALTPAQLAAIALWVAHSHAFAAADATPYLAVSSAEKRSGKTRLLEVLALLVARPWLTGRTTAAALVRKIDKHAPTLLLDESDAAFKGDKEYAEALRGVLNTGHRRGGGASLCVGQGASLDVRDFATFCPKAIAGLGKLPDTVADRAIPIEMKRRAPGEHVERFRHRTVKADATPLRDELAAWESRALANLIGAEPPLPDELDDRAADGWEPLLAIADLAGGDWPERARRAALALSAGEQRDDDSIGVRLLRDIRSIFDAKGTDRLFSEHLASALCGVEESSWSALGKRDKPLDKPALARLLAKYEIRPKQIRVGSVTAKGYKLNAFADAFARYLPQSDRNTETSESDSAASESHAEPKQTDFLDPDIPRPNSASKEVSDSEQVECFDVSDNEAITGAKDAAEEVLQHTAVALDGAAAAAAAFFLGEERVEAALPTLGGVVERGDRGLHGDAPSSKASP